MAYLPPPFEADAFVGYAHADPKGKGDSHWKIWSRRLIDLLENDIGQAGQYLQGVMIWSDEKGGHTNGPNY